MLRFQSFIHVFSSLHKLRNTQTLWWKTISNLEFHTRFFSGHVSSSFLSDVGFCVHRACDVINDHSSGVVVHRSTSVHRIQCWNELGSAFLRFEWNWIECRVGLVWIYIWVSTDLELTWSIHVHVRSVSCTCCHKFCLGFIMLIPTAAIKTRWEAWVIF